MADRDSEPLNKLIESVADGESINWHELEKKFPADAELQRLLRNLRLVSEVADLHRSQVDAPSPDDVSTVAVAGPYLPATAKHILALRDADQKEPTGSGVGQWGHLLLRRKIGEGAFGEVFHAHDTWLDHPVALKLLKPEIASREDFPSILREARKLARVRHPNVVTVHGADSHNGRVGFWMDLIEGDTLASLVTQHRRFSAGEATTIGQEVCSALAAVHHAKLVHRDIKAQNVMRASDGGRIILMDFGAGEFMDQPPESRARGTPLYLAPELFENRNATVQSDIYAIGVLLFFLVSGSFPVQGSSIPELIEAHKRGRRRHLWDGRPDLPHTFVSIVERAIDPDPKRRYASAGEMNAALMGERPTETTVPLPGSEEGEQKTPLQYLGRAALVALAAVVLAEVLGLIATRLFDVLLRVDPDFSMGPVEAFWVGIRALIPFGIYWLAGVAIVGVLAGLQLLFKSPLRAISSRCSKWVGTLDPASIATTVFLLGVVGCVVITWASYDLVTAMLAVYEAPPNTQPDLSALSPAASGVDLSHNQYSALLSFLLGLAAWRWFPRLEKRLDDPSTVRNLKWATLALAFLVVTMAALPRPLIREYFEVVLFQNQAAVVIGTSNDELLLYAPDTADRSRRRVRKDDPGLQRTGLTRRLFEPVQDPK